MPDTPILVIDDNILNLKLVDFLLSAQGYEVHKALNASEALSVLETVNPSLILMDLQLPGVDGFELTRKLKKNPKFSHIPIIAITAYAMKGDEEKALAAGCDGYITKPIDIKTLPDVLAEYIEKADKF
jgi:two-component system, cell cycle response regulator DivK